MQVTLCMFFVSFSDCSVSQSELQVICFSHGNSKSLQFNTSTFYIKELDFLIFPCVIDTEAFRYPCVPFAAPRVLFAISVSVIEQGMHGPGRKSSSSSSGRETAWLSFYAPVAPLQGSLQLRKGNSVCIHLHRPYNFS